MEPELIVVGVDGSPGSVEALRWAAAEVGFRNARLRVVTTWEYPYAYTGIPDGEMMMPVGQIEAGARACLDSSVDDAIDDPRQREAVERLVVSGHPSHVLRKQSEHADMVVVGARGHGGFLGLLVGSTADQLVRHAACPVVVVRERGIRRESEAAVKAQRRQQGSMEIRRTVITETFALSTVQSVGEPENADLADQVRTRVGPLIRRLNLPRIHVMAEGKRVLLHGDVGTEADAAAIEAEVAGLDVVESVESHLHIGLIPGDSRPSDFSTPASAMMTQLLQAAEAIGISGEPARAAVWGALTAVLEQIPPDERRHVLDHFPLDVSAFVKPRRRFGDENIHWQSELELEAAAALRGGISLDDAEMLVPEVIGLLRKFVPEEDRDVQATLHAHLRELWQRSTVADTVITDEAWL